MGDSYKEALKMADMATKNRATGGVSNDQDPERQPLTTTTTMNLDGQDNNLRFEDIVDPNLRVLTLENQPSNKMRSQSLPHPDDHARRMMPRARFFSGVAPNEIGARMRHLSMGTFSAIGEQDENQDRGNWSNPVEFLLSCLGYAVGLGNVWRFPYLVYINGGGAFLIAYCIMLFGCGMPTLFAELALGQYSSQGPLTIWAMCPLAKGLGLSMIIASIMCSIYYNLITSWSFYYLFLSMRNVLPWTCCEGDWATDRCFTFASEDKCPANESTRTVNSTLERNSSNLKYAADEFFHNQVLRISGGFHEVGAPQWELVLALFISWLVVFCVLVKGIKSVGKTVYITSTFPYLVLTILLVYAAGQDGASDGIRFFFNTNWTKLTEPKVWGDAASQIFYSTGVCMGGAITLASYNTFKNNVYRDAVIVSLGNSATSLFSGIVVFSILGVLAHKQGVEISEVATEGAGLTFITYPQAVTLFPASPIFSTLFFLMLLSLALSTMFPTTENIATALLDQFPNTLRPYKFFVTAALCFTLFLLGLPLTTKAGMYILQLMDAYAVGYALLILGFIEIMIISWRYSAQRLSSNIQSMVKRRPCIGWVFVWKFVTPTLLLFAAIFTFSKLTPLTYGQGAEKYTYPDHVTAIGVVLTCISLGPTFIYALYKITYEMKTSPTDATGLHRLWHVLKTSTAVNESEWHPALEKYRHIDTKCDDEVFD